MLCFCKGFCCDAHTAVGVAPNSKALPPKYLELHVSTRGIRKSPQHVLRWDPNETNVGISITRTTPQRSIKDPTGLWNPFAT